MKKEHIDLFDNQKELSEEEKSHLRLTAYEYPIFISSYEEVIRKILSLNRDGLNRYIEFPDGTRLYSVDITTEDDAYLKLFGRTKEEQKAERKRLQQEQMLKINLEMEKKEMLAVEKIPGRIEEGKKYIDESKWKDWEVYVNKSARDMYHGMDIDDTLKLLKMIEDGMLWEEIQITLNKLGSGFPYDIVRSNVVYFSKKSEEADSNLDKHSI